MNTPVSGSGQPYFSPTRLRRLNAAMRGEQEPPFKGGVPTSHDGTVDVIITRGPSEGDLAKAMDPRQLQAKLEEKGIQVEDSLGQAGVTAKVDQKTARDLEKDGFLVYDNRPRDMWPGLPKVSMPPRDWSMPKVDPVSLTGAGTLHSQGITGAGQVVAVLDSGFDHPGTGLLAWQDLVEGSPQPIDPVGHGTHVAGDVLQIAPDAKIVAVRVMNGEGQGRPSDIIKGIQWVVDNKDQLGVEVINMSLGAGPDGMPDKYDPLNRAVEAATRAGITVVAAAGNSGPEGHTIGSPGDAPSSLTVGSTLQRDQVSEFSSRGPTDDGLVKPDVVAPGEFIVSWSVPDSQMEQTGKTVQTLRDLSGADLKKLLDAKPQLVGALGLPPDITSRSDEEVEVVVKSGLPPIFVPQEGLIAAPGTSFAAPIVAGLVADLEQARDLDPGALKQILRDTADPMPGAQPNEQGQGFVNAQKAAEAALRHREA